MLDLSINNKSGTIPSCMDQFTLKVHYEDDNYGTVGSIGNGDYFDIDSCTPVLSGGFIMWK